MSDDQYDINDVPPGDDTPSTFMPSSDEQPVETEHVNEQDLNAMPDPSEVPQGPDTPQPDPTPEPEPVPGPEPAP